MLPHVLGKLAGRQCAEPPLAENHWFGTGWQGASAQNHLQLRTIGLEELDWIVIISFYPNIFPFFASLFALNVFIPKNIYVIYLFFVFSFRFPQ